MKKQKPKQGGKLTQRKPAALPTAARGTPMPPSAPTAPVQAAAPAPSKPGLAEQLPPGVYYDAQRHTALVHRLGKVEVYFVTMRSGTIDAEHMHAREFVQAFTGRWPAYPLRRAARQYLQSHMPKSDSAMAVLRALVQS